MEQRTGKGGGLYSLLIFVIFEANRRMRVLRIFEGRGDGMERGEGDVRVGGGGE
jgi:hypothetical protein